MTRPARSPRLTRSAWMLLAAATLAGCGGGPVRVEPPELSAQAEAACSALVDALPERVADQERREVSPTGAFAAAWGDPAIVLRCGVPKPQGLTRASTCTSVNGVDWFIPEDQLQAEGDLTMTAFNREQYVEVRMPAAYWPPATTLADLAPAVDRALARTGRCR